ncbi:MAG: hypothetical protein L0H73_02970 [Nitrococcus sp.]|nr:hypothetical protein [Nitrococcus sp.]
MAGNKLSSHYTFSNNLVVQIKLCVTRTGFQLARPYNRSAARYKRAPVPDSLRAAALGAGYANLQVANAPYGGKTP